MSKIEDRIEVMAVGVGDFGHTAKFRPMKGKVSHNREINGNQVAKLVAGWQPHLCGICLLIDQGDHFMILDGQHRIKAAAEIGGQRLVMRVLATPPESNEEAAKMLTDINSGQLRWSIGDHLRTWSKQSLFEDRFKAAGVKDNALSFSPRATSGKLNWGSVMRACVAGSGASRSQLLSVWLTRDETLLANAVGWYQWYQPFCTLCHEAGIKNMNHSKVLPVMFLIYVENANNPALDKAFQRLSNSKESGYSRQFRLMARDELKATFMRAFNHMIQKKFIYVDGKTGRE
jgi:hypothetical protein